MIFKKPVFFIFLFLILGNTGFVFSQTDSPPQIVNPDSSPIIYCSDSVLVAPFITIKNVTINEQAEGMKISIANYRSGEDILVWDEIHEFNYNWKGSIGTLEISGVGSSEQYQEAIRKVYYKNIANVPTLNARSFSISLLDADYLPQTEHFYRYVPNLDITWKEAQVAANDLRYYGLQGYLATITSKSENDFIWSKIDGVGWIGATDESEEGKWIWATGPEQGTHFWQGGPNGVRVNGEYSYWNNGEPNDQGGEDYAHINANPNSIPKSWNDLRNEGDGPGSQYYRAQGFVVEFGGMLGDPLVSLSATAKIQVNKIAFSDQRDFNICQGESVQLNLLADNSYRYNWTPDKKISSTTVSNPLVTPDFTTTYNAVGKLGQCTDSAKFDVRVVQLPQSMLKTDTTICSGESVKLDAGIHSSYIWSTGETTQTITVSEEGSYSVILKNELNCAVEDSIELIWSVRPELDYGELDTLVCGSYQQVLNLSFVSGTATTNLIAFQPEKVTIENPNTLNPKIIVDEYGVYQFKMELIDEYSCEFLDTLEIEFHNQPDATFFMDEEKCKGYSLDLEFDGTTYEETVFSWYSNDTVYQSEIGLTEITIPLGYGQTNRTVGLKLNEQGCVDSSFTKVTVTPVMNFGVQENAQGCTPLYTKFENSDVEDIQSYYWDFGDGNTSTIENPANTYYNADTTDLLFDVALTIVSIEGCENTGVLKDTITVHPIPTVDFSFNEEDCNPESMEIWYKGSGNNRDKYFWDLTAFKPEEIISDPGSTKGPLEIKRMSEPTVSIGIQVVSEFGCKTDTIKKTWKRKPLIQIVVDETEGCPPLQTKIKATVLDDVDQVIFNYNLGDGTIGTSDSVIHVYTNPDSNNEVSFVAKSLTTGCSDTSIYSEEIYVYPAPVASFTPNPGVVLISNPLILFENRSAEATSYEWDFGDNSAISTQENPSHLFYEMGFYDVLLFAYNNFGCEDSISQQVVVSFDKLFPPNAFSPNATLEEDREFRIYSEGVVEEGYQLQIYNRWGEMFFESLSQETGWDGKMKSGNFAPAGVYTWVIQFRDFTGKNHKQQGTVTLLF